ncbi:hypothetical protein HMPREF0658_1156 [Hoylesella marshii DSM 16973 = JCM 13450]|uniref:Uncharacterized protein n=1 Tax=Hoylesella marshii DSM 16973 = JCM 13450 TaxID=862515 RepID=E0NSK5_9BACT|nr:hypothetical protein HMPREF0658_1156 [Hoylesella marshii DSM 16973 = JCM 13450]
MLFIRNFSASFYDDSSVFDTQKFLVRIFKVVKLRLVSSYLCVVQMAFVRGKAGNLS